MNVSTNKFVWVHDETLIGYADQLGMAKRKMPKSFVVDGMGEFNLDGKEGSDKKTHYYLYWNNNILIKIAV